MERKLSQMILNHSFYGILDQGRGILEVYESSQDDVAYTKAYEVIGNMDLVVENLFDRVRGLATLSNATAAVAAKSSATTTA